MTRQKDSIAPASGNDVSAEAVRSVGERMAADIFENAKQYLEGNREDFRAYFGLTNPPHKIAAKRFAELLAAEHFGGEVELGSSLSVWPQGYSETSNRYCITEYARVAEMGGRCIYAVIAGELKAVDSRLVIDVLDSSYSSVAPEIPQS